MPELPCAPAHPGAGAVDTGTRAGSGDLAAEVAALTQLDATALRRRWRALVGGAVPADLGRPLMLRVLSYKLQAQRLGDLDRASLRQLSALSSSATAPVDEGCSKDDGGTAQDSVQASAVSPPAPMRMVRPGTVLLREHGGVTHRVTVLADGCSWNGSTYASLSQVAFAITGTKWNGPRFFGLRDKPAAEPGGERPSRAKVPVDARAGAAAARPKARAARAAPSSSRGVAP